jgi:hypothetical protein
MTELRDINDIEQSTAPYGERFHSVNGPGKPGQLQIFSPHQFNRVHGLEDVDEHEVKHPFEYANDLLSQGDVVVRTDHPLDIIKDRRFKSQHETGHSAGWNDPELRARTEADKFEGYGYDQESDPQDTRRPIYGYVRRAGGEHVADPNHQFGDSDALSYGSVRFHMKRTGPYETTVTRGDSLDDEGLPFTTHDIENVAKSRVSPDYLGADQFRPSFDRSKFYHEAQLHPYDAETGVPTSAVHSIVFEHNPWRAFSDTTQGLADKASKMLGEQFGDKAPSVHVEENREYTQESLGNHLYREQEDLRQQHYEQLQELMSEAREEAPEGTSPFGTDHVASARASRARWMTSVIDRPDLHGVSHELRGRTTELFDAIDQRDHTVRSLMSNPESWTQWEDVKWNLRAARDLTAQQ